MLKNYLLIAMRNMRRNKLYSLINMGSLAIGIAVTMTILLYVLHEHSYDRWHTDASRIYAVSSTETYGGTSWQNYQLSYQTGPLTLQKQPTVEAMVRTREAFEGVDLQNQGSSAAHFRESSRFLYADSNFFRFFSFRLLQGRAATVLKRPFTVVLSETAAKKYFGTADPVGRILIMDEKYPLEVTGVAADPPSNSSIVFDMIASMSTMAGVEKYQPYLDDKHVHRGTFNTWLLLKHPADVAGVERCLSRLSMQEESADIFKSENAYGDKTSHQYALLSLGDTHLKGYDAASRNHYLDIFTLVAGLILLLALVNYMSLATARAVLRAKEVGVRKVMGAARSKIAQQFYVESTLYAVLSFVAGGLLFLVFRPYFMQLINVRLDAGFMINPIVLAGFVALLALVILVSGSYPALVLSGFRPVAVLYGKMSRRMGGERVRKGFIVLQFTISMALVIGSVVIGKQLYYLRHVDTGMDRENVVMLPFGSTMDHYGVYKREVASLPAVHQVATARMALFHGSEVQLVSIPGKAPIQLGGMTVDSNFISLLGLKWKEKPGNSGWFDRDHLVLNQTAVDAFDLGRIATGKQIHVGEGVITVAGVIRDFNYWSLHRGIEPFSLTVSADVDKEWPQGISGCLYVKIAAHANTPTVIDAIKKIYSKFDTHTPFEFQFLDEAYDLNYKLEDRLAGMISAFTVITIIIACLGLFGLATFSAQQRVKEIGIRKVLGASAGSIGALLSRDFLRPVILAVLIACPVSWWTMHRWLQDYAYRTTFSWWIFPLAGGVLLLIALATVLSRSLRAAHANPVINLRSE